MAVCAMLESYLEELKSIRAAIVRLAADPTSSTSVSSANGGSYSASYIDLGTLTRREAELIALIAKLHRAGEGFGGLGVSYPIYCGG